MAETMTELQLQMQEKRNTGTAWTRNKSFDKNGYLIVKDLWDPEELYHPVPELRGQLNYWDNDPTHFNHTEVFFLSVYLSGVLIINGQSFSPSGRLVLI